MAEARTWETNAVEFAALTKQGIDIRLAALVACSVEEGKPGRPPAKRYARTVKASAREFAQAAGTSHPRVLRHLKAWDGTKGLPSSETLQPGDVNDIDVDDATAERFIGTFHRLAELEPSGGRPRASQREIIARVKADPAYAAELTEALHAAVPETMQKTVLDHFVREEREDAEKRDREGGLLKGRRPGGLSKLIMELGGNTYLTSGSAFHLAVSGHYKRGGGFSDEDVAAIRDVAERGARYGQMILELIDPRASDEELQRLLSQEG